MKILVSTSWLCLIVGCFLAPRSEFGRLIGVEVVVASLVSVGVAAMVTLTVMLICAVAAYVYSRVALSIVDSALTGVADTFDSVPAIVWILAITAVLDEPRQLIASLIFVLLVTPGALRVVIGECSRQQGLQYILAARSLGVGHWRLVFGHMLPNAGSTLNPFFMSVYGGAIAVSGAIGILGSSNRTDLNLGTLLLRGKEQLFLSPWLFAMTLLAYLAIFSMIFCIEERVVAGSRHEDSHR